MKAAQEVWHVTREHYFVISPTAYGQESCACGWYRDGWDAPTFEVHLASRLGLTTPPAERGDGGQPQIPPFRPQGGDR